MLYYWTRLFNKSEVKVWKVESEQELLTSAKELYLEEPFDFGFCTDRTYQLYTKKYAAVKKEEKK